MSSASFLPLVGAAKRYALENGGELLRGALDVAAVLDDVMGLPRNVATAAPVEAPGDARPALAPAREEARGPNLRRRIDHDNAHSCVAPAGLRGNGSRDIDHHRPALSDRPVDRAGHAVGETVRAPAQGEGGLRFRGVARAGLRVTFATASGGEIAGTRRGSWKAAMRRLAGT